MEHLELSQMARQNKSRLIYHNTVQSLLLLGLTLQTVSSLAASPTCADAKPVQKQTKLSKEPDCDLVASVTSATAQPMTCGKITSGEKKLGFRTAAVWQMLSVKQRERDWHARLDVTTSKRSTRWGGWCNSVSKIPWKYLEHNGCDDSKAA